MNWEDLLKQIGDFGVRGMEQTGLPVFLIAMASSLLSGLFVAYLYAVFYKGRASGTQVHRAFPLLGVSVTAIFITIQFSLPLSLGLLGALSIVRFRTPIKDPEEIAFIMLVVATSLCCASFNLLFLTVILATAVLTLLVVRFLRGARPLSAGSGMIVISLPERDGKDKELGGSLISFLRRELPTGSVDSMTEGDNESTFSYRFRELDAERIGELRSGVRSIAAPASCNIYFDRAGEG